MRSLAALSSRAAALLCLGIALPAQQDLLTPFRNPQSDVPIPDRQVEVFRQLRLMMNLAENVGPVSTDSQGREICDNPRWKEAYETLLEHYVDPGFLSYVLRNSGSADNRRVALYGSYFVTNPEYVIDLIEHIPGEPVQRFREASYPRAINYLRVHLPRKFGDLTEEEVAGLNRPPVGSPVANSMGITRELQPEDRLHALDLRPFVQLLEQDAPSDRAQGLWFIKECFWIDKGLATIWMERMAPRLRLFLMSDDDAVRKECIGVIEAADPKRRPAPAVDADAADIEAWLDDVMYELYPPIRVISSGLIELYPSEDLDKVVEVGSALLGRDGIGSLRSGKTGDGMFYRGFAVLRAPDPLDRLGMPVGAVITAVNGQPVGEGTQLLEVIRSQLEHKLQFLVEYVHDGRVKAIEYRLRK